MDIIKLNFQKNISWHLSNVDILRSETAYEEEINQITPSLSKKRREEFLLGRVCAKYALNKLGFTQRFPLLKGPSGEVLWPENITGSISHKDGIALAAVSYKSNLKGLGVDIELNKQSNSIDTFKRVLSKNEFQHFNSLSVDENSRFCTYLKAFSVKEACYKAFFEASKVKLGFFDVELSIETRGIDTKESFNGVLQNKIPGYDSGFRFKAHSSIHNNLIISWVIV